VYLHRLSALLCTVVLIIFRNIVYYMIVQKEKIFWLEILHRFNIHMLQFA